MSGWFLSSAGKTARLQGFTGVNGGGNEKKYNVCITPGSSAIADEKQTGLHQQEASHPVCFSLSWGDGHTSGIRKGSAVGEKRRC